MVSRANHRRRTRRKRRGGGGLNARFGTTRIQGQTLQKEVAENYPDITWTAPPLDTFITLLCYDPDATAKAWLHWLVVNCVGDGPTSGDTLMEWEPPAPPPKTGKHRYILQAFTHTYKIPVEEKPSQRGYFSVKAFVEKNRLTPLAQTSFLVSG